MKLEWVYVGGLYIDKSKNVIIAEITNISVCNNYQWTMVGVALPASKLGLSGTTSDVYSAMFNAEAIWESWKKEAGLQCPQ